MRLLTLSALVILFFLASCAACGTSPNSQMKNGSAATAAALPTLAIDYTVPGTVPRLTQGKQMDCWATSSAILVSWKEKKTVTTPQFVATLSQKFRVIYDTDTGLFPDDQPDLLSEAKLRQEAPQNYTVNGWLSLLKNFGPLWATTATAVGKNWAVHARVVIAIKGDGTPDGTTLRIIDPANGSETTETVTAFAKKMEDLAKLDLGAGGDIRPMVIHF